MKERVAESQEILFPSKYTGIKLEPGWHKNKNVHESVWNPAVRERMYQYNPKVITVDGMLPFFSSNPNYYRRYLPGIPTEINGIDREICVVLADMGEYSRILPVEEFNFNLETEAKNLDDQFLDESAEAVESAAIKVVALAASSLLLVPINYKVSRRGFLKQLIGLGTLAFSTSSLALAASQISATCLSPLTRNELEREIVQLSSLLTGKVVNHWWLDGRTALMIAKTQDAIDYLGLPRSIPASIVVGAAHLHKADYLNNKDQRDAAIKNFAVNLLAGFDEIYKKHGLNSNQRKWLHQILLDFCAKTAIVTLGVNQRQFSSDDILSHSNFQSWQVVAATSGIL